VTPELIAKYTGVGFFSCIGSSMDEAGSSNMVASVNMATTPISNATSEVDSSFKCLTGDTGSWLVFPSAILPAAFTWSTLARYANPTANLGRILNGASPPNWLSGVHSGKTGLTYRHNTDQWIT